MSEAETIDVRRKLAETVKRAIQTAEKLKAGASPVVPDLLNAQMREPDAKASAVAVTQPGAELTDEEIRERLEGPGFRKQFKARLDSITKKFREIGSK